MKLFPSRMELERDRSIVESYLSDSQWFVKHMECRAQAYERAKQSQKRGSGMEPFFFGNSDAVAEAPMEHRCIWEQAGGKDDSEFEIPWEILGGIISTLLAIFVLLT
jgi:hypothetical protein